MQAYSNPKRESEPTALPDVEVFTAAIMRCPVCEAEYPETDRGGTSYRNTNSETTCCHGKQLTRVESAYWYWFCLPGCLPDSDPIGPFATEAEALADAQSNASDHEAPKLDNVNTHNIDIGYALACNGACADCGMSPRDCIKYPCPHNLSGQAKHSR